MFAELTPARKVGFTAFVSGASSPECLYQPAGATPSLVFLADRHLLLPSGASGALVTRSRKSARQQLSVGTSIHALQVSAQNTYPVLNRYGGPGISGGSPLKY